MSSKWELEKENLEDLIINQQLSHKEIGKRYESTDSNIKKVAKRLGINLPIRRNINPNETFNKKEKEIISNIIFYESQIYITSIFYVYIILFILTVCR